MTDNLKDTTLTSERVGSVVTYVDEYGKAHNAIVTRDWSPLSDVPGSVNLVYIVDDVNMTDSCGVQIARATSVVHQPQQSAHGRYWK